MSISDSSAERSTSVLPEIAMLPRILEAAQLLHACGLVDDAPSTFVKRYVQAHPIINATLNQHWNKP